VNAKFFSLVDWLIFFSFNYYDFICDSDSDRGCLILIFVIVARISCQHMSVCVQRRREIWSRLLAASPREKWYRERVYAARITQQLTTLPNCESSRRSVQQGENKHVEAGEHKFWVALAFLKANYKLFLVQILIICASEAAIRNSLLISANLQYLRLKAQ
jgi:hypothetical protein